MKTITRFVFCLAVLFVGFNIAAQIRSQSSAEILQSLKKLGTVGSVLYVAAHPDDENTRLIAWLSKDKLVRTGYLSLTRGDGGQNLIGTEFGEGLGVIRTQELLEARKRDGGEQFFTRAVDFGFSKSFDETLNFWDREKVLSDIVWVIRKFRPDVIITRFPPDNRAGHGHHSSSAILGAEAFRKAADPNAFPEQLKLVKPYQAKRIYFNTGSFFANGAELDKSEFLKLDVGSYNPLLGKSVNEIASESRSQHKSQGFGVPLARGSQIEYFAYTDGEKAEKDLFDGIDLTWKRIKGGEAIGQKIAEIEKSFDFNDPEKSLPALADLHKLLNSLSGSASDKDIINNKLDELNKIILACAGIYAEAVADDFSVAIEQKVKGKVNLINRSNFKLILNSLNVNEYYLNTKRDSLLNQVLENNKLYSFSININTSKQPISQQYWLTKPYKTLYQVDNQELIGLPENPPSQIVVCNFTMPNGETLFLELPVLYKWTDRVEGEQFRPFVVTPPATVNVSNKVYIFKDNQSQMVSLTVRAWQKDLKGSLKLDLPSGWHSEPSSVPFSITAKGQEQKFDFKIFPAPQPPKGEYWLKAMLSFKGETENSPLGGWRDAHSYQAIEYPHISKQAIMNLTQAKLIKLDLKTTATKIAYIPGAGDDVAESLKQVGYNVTIFPADNLLSADLSQFQAVIIGIRAYNTEKGLVSGNEKLLKYVENGGKLIVQYNTPDMLLSKITPFDMAIGRNRVTEENSQVTFLDPNHPVFNSPNKLTQQDFEGWVQERGLYYANTWGKEFTPLISWNDKGETPQQGGLLVAKYGKGSYIFTGISFFRQLPAGVPGAYRLMANLIAW
jgi:LmbE family N-acetylglucosaminyl deacetylase